VSITIVQSAKDWSTLKRGPRSRNLNVRLTNDTNGVLISEICEIEPYMLPGDVALLGV
jgi:hypothetical protein